jgi:hypothetical protein
MQYFNDAVPTTVVFTVVSEDVEGDGSCGLFYNTPMFS